MGNALRHVRGESQKNIVRFIEGLSGKYSRWDIWQDFIIMSAIAIANTMGGPYAAAREEMYRSRAEKYSAKELEVFADMLLEVVAELERDPEQDFLGELFYGTRPRKRMERTVLHSVQCLQGDVRDDLCA